MRQSIIFLLFISSSEEQSGSEDESGSGTEEDGSGDTASEPGSQHTTPDNVSGDEIEHGEIVSRSDKNGDNKIEKEEGEDLSEDEGSKKETESREESQDTPERNSEKVSRHRKKHKHKNRFVVYKGISKKIFTKMMTTLYAKGCSRISSCKSVIVSGKPN